MSTTATMQPDQSNILRGSESSPPTPVPTSTQTIMVPGINVWLYGTDTMKMGALPKGTILLVLPANK